MEKFKSTYHLYPPYSLVQSGSGEERVFIKPGSLGTFANVWFDPDQGIVVDAGERLEVIASPLEAGRMVLCAVELLNEQYRYWLRPCRR